jgi:hypothetical protein
MTASKHIYCISHSSVHYTGGTPVVTLRMQVRRQKTASTHLSSLLDSVVNTSWCDKLTQKRHCWEVDNRSLSQENSLLLWNPEGYHPFHKRLLIVPILSQTNPFHTQQTNIITCISIAREQLGKHVAAKNNSWPIIVFTLPDNRPINNLQLGALQQYKTSIVRQRSVNKFRQQ